VEAQTPKVPSDNIDNPIELRQQCLNMIPGHEIKPFFIRPHLKREFIIGLIGLRGDGKSGSGASIALVDFAMRGIPIWSNMDIRVDIEIDDATGMKYGLRKGGIARYQSQHIDKQSLLKLDERYTDSFLWLDEINVEYSNVRRFMSNTNVDFNIVIQELRKFHSSLGYSVIDEMFIDSQLRSSTDVFIKCEDTALSVDGLASKKPTGIDFKWTIYPMSGYLVGRENSYYNTKKALPPVYFHFQRMRGIYNTNLFQRKGNYSAKTQILAQQSEEITEQYNQWGWLEERAKGLKNAGILELSSMELWQALGLSERGLSPAKIKAMLPTYGIKRKNRYEDIYLINDFDLASSLK
jgi:hypothetical protein